MRKIVLATLALFMAGNVPTYSQTRYLNDQIDPSKKNPLRLRDIANRECIKIKGALLQDKINTTVVSHLLNAENNCAKVIEIKACYLRSTRCVEFSLRSREKKQVVLGIGVLNTSMPFFPFDFTEKAVF